MASWESGLCSCCADPGGVQACCLGFCCTAELYGLNMEKLTRPHECVLGGNCIAGGIVWYTLAGAYGSCWITQCVTRGAIRKKYSIPGNVVSDCLISFCCCCCAVIQASRTLNAMYKYFSHTGWSSYLIDVLRCQEYNQLHSDKAPPAGIPAVGRNFGQSEDFTVLNSMEPNLSKGQ